MNPFFVKISHSYFESRELQFNSINQYLKEEDIYVRFIRLPELKSTNIVDTNNFYLLDNINKNMN